MKKSLLVCTVLSMAAALASAGPQPRSGTIVSQTSVACGEKKSKKQDLDLMCQQYVVRTTTTDYTVRQEKPANQALIPLSIPVEFTLDKNKMKFKANGKSYEYQVVGQAMAPTGTSQTSPASNP
jgi:hypothetical protein